MPSPNLRKFFQTLFLKNEDLTPLFLYQNKQTNTNEQTSPAGRQNVMKERFSLKKGASKPDFHVLFDVMFLN